MSRLSRRILAVYATEQLLVGKSAKVLAKEISSVLVADKRIAEIELLLADINYELEVRGQLAAAKVTTAHDLSNELRAEIKKLVKQATNVSQVNLDEAVDSAVIGGVRIETATRIWDKTVASQLAKLKGAA